MPTPPSVAVLIPVFDDWDAANLLCRELDRAAETLTGVLLRIHLIDDGSSMAPPAQAFSWTPRSLQGISVIRLRRNVGHQRAIALGLAYLYDVTDVSAVLVMDGDGEDKPEDAIALVRLHLADPTRIIFAARRRRIEGLAFRAGYALYRFCHWLLTGIEVRIGNFSIVPRRLIGAIVVSSESWSHYAASVVKAKLPFTTVPMDRGTRLAGQSRMNYVALVTHGLSAMSVFRELAGTRVLLASCAAAAVLLALAPMFFFGPGILLFIILLVAIQAVAASFVLAFFILGGRDQSSFLPIRDYHFFIDGVSTMNGHS